jgi:hypothetical protein
MIGANGGDAVNPPKAEPAGRAGSTTRPPISLDEVRVLVLRAQGGDPTAAPRLRVLFDRDPEQLTKLGGGDIVASLKDLLVAKDVGGHDILAREARLRQIDRIRDELAGPGPTTIERLLAERAALCWFELHTLDARVVRRRDEEGEFRSADDLDCFRDRAQRRYLAALKTLAQVRRLAVPLLQVNLAHNQLINTDGPLEGRPS